MRRATPSFHLVPRALVVAAGLLLAALTLQEPAQAANGRLKVVIVDKDTGQPIPCRIHLQNQKGVAQKAGGLPFWSDHFVCPGTLELSFRKGNYTFEIERGLEYLWQKGYFVINENAQDEKKIELRRFINMSEHGWYSGDLHVHRPAKDMELLMQADDLHVAPVISWWNEKNDWTSKALPKEPIITHDKNRFYHLMGGEDERAGGTLLYFNGSEPLNIAGAKAESPSSLKFIYQAREKQPNVWIDIEKPLWWDLPAWIASGKVDSIELANSQMNRSKMQPDDPAGRPRDKQRFRDGLGGGHSSQHIYYQLLNCGIRLAPSAGSGTGVVPNPLGYNRVYVHVDGEFTYAKWWEGLRDGRSFVTNGPLLRPDVEGELPGHTFAATQGETITLNPFLSLSTRDKIDYLDIVQDGDVRYSIRLDEYAKLKGKLPALEFKRSGWFVIRAVAENDKTFRFAATAPYFVKIGDEIRISKRSVQYFLDWENERIAKLEELLKDAPADERAETMGFHEASRKFWSELLLRANAE